MTLSITRCNILPINKVYITNLALQVIKAEANRHHQDTHEENETGGVLIGRRIEHMNSAEVLITAATGPGERAYHNPIEFNPDVTYINQQLDRYRALYPNMDYIGTWHKHPLDYPMFSPGDVQTAHMIFADPSYKVDEIINPIVWVDKGQFTIRYYYMHRQMARKQEAFIEIPGSRIQSISEDHPLVIKEQSQGHSNVTVPACISEEYHRLKEYGHQTELKQQGQEYYFTVTLASHPDMVLHLIAPDGYPTLPPSLLVEQHGKELLISDGGVIDKWTSNAERSYIVDVVHGVLSNLPVSLPTPALSTTPPAPPAYPTGRGGHQFESTPRQTPTSGFSSALPAVIVIGAVLVVLLIGIGIISLARNVPSRVTSPVPTTEESIGDAISPSGTGVITDTPTITIYMLLETHQHLNAEIK